MSWRYNLTLGRAPIYHQFLRKLAKPAFPNTEGKICLGTQREVAIPDAYRETTKTLTHEKETKCSVTQTKEILILPIQKRKSNHTIYGTGKIY